MSDNHNIFDMLDDDKDFTKQDSEPVERLKKVSKITRVSFDRLYKDYVELLESDWIKEEMKFSSNKERRNYASRIIASRYLHRGKTLMRTRQEILNELKHITNEKKLLQLIVEVLVDIRDKL